MTWLGRLLRRRPADPKPLFAGDPARPVPWSSLAPGTQTALRAAYAEDPACLTGTCSLEAKTEAFASWLGARGVTFTAGDLRRP